MKFHKSHHLTFSLLGVLALGVFLFSWIATTVFAPTAYPPTRYGVTFSTRYADQLGLDPREAYRALIEELGVRSVRLPVYWSEIERAQGEFDWELMDQLVAYSDALGVRLTMVVGVKVPRWPECYVPDWAEMLNTGEQHRAALSMMQTVVDRYQGVKAIERWQVENEPFFPFGLCPSLTVAQFQERVDLVRSLDPSRPIQITVSGEIGPWTTEAEAADILGISLYRLTWNDLFGYFMYPLSPEYYYTRAQLVRGDVERVIISELQAEPWFPEPLESRSLDHWYQAFDTEMFENNIAFVEDAHLSEAYLWGAEWWYYLKSHGDERLWNVARGVFSEQRSQ